MSIETRLNAINDHLVDDYSVLTLAGADLTGVNKNIVNLKMSWKERLLYFMNNGTDIVWNNWNKVSGTGTTLSLNNTEEAPMSLTYKGNTYQEGTPTPSSPIPVQVVSGDNTINVTGKNLQEQRVANATIGNVGVFSSTTGYDLGIAKINQGQEYVISGIEDPANYQIVLGFFYSKPTFGSVTYNNSRTILVQRVNTFTAPITGYVAFRVNSTDLYTMLEKGSTATTYEAYTGASYPINLGSIELCKIGTYQDKIDKSTGKNILNVSQTNVELSGNTPSNLPTMAYTDTGFSMSGYSGGAWVYVPCEVGKSYKLKFNTNGSFTNVRIFNKDKSSTLQYISDITSGEKTVNVTTTTENGFYLRFWRDNTQPTATLYYAMIGEDITTYEPYGTDWYLKKEIGKYTFTGNESWTTSSYGTNSWGIENLISTNYDVTKKQVMSNIFKGVPQQDREISGDNIIYTFSNTGINIRNTTLATQADVQNAVAGNYVIYALATPTYETITDTTLIGQLEALKKSYEGQTNISQVNNDLPFELDVVALSNE